ncbi:hypothetical protein [Biostraticola tofi]|nr:hypothetical protein [Biostraticola tofi]
MTINASAEHGVRGFQCGHDNGYENQPLGLIRRLNPLAIDDHWKS